MSDEDHRRKDEKLFLLIISALKEPNIYNKLKLCYLLTFSIPEEIFVTYNVEDFRKDMKALLIDEEFVRAINNRQAILQEDSIVYFGPEHIACVYNYNIQMENTILQIELNVTEFLAKIFNELDISEGFSIDTIDNPSVGEKK